MALAPVSVPAFPDVPVAPGVPTVLRPITAAATPILKVGLLAADVVQIARMFEGPRWGIFLQGAPVLVGDSVVGVDYRREWRIATYPVEKGGFASYNKVAEPFDVRVTFACSGKQSLISTILSGGAIGALITGNDPQADNRAEFMQALEDFGASLELVTVVTPEFSFPSCNITHIDYRREARKGTTLVLIDVWLQEVRVTGTAAFSQTKEASGAAPVDHGAVQPAAPPSGLSNPVVTPTLA